MRIRPLRWDAFMVVLCYFCAFWVCASPFIPYVFTSYGSLYLGTFVLGTPLAAVGVWLNHLAAKAPKKD